MRSLLRAVGSGVGLPGGDLGVLLHGDTVPGFLWEEQLGVLIVLFQADGLAEP